MTTQDVSTQSQKCLAGKGSKNGPGGEPVVDPGREGGYGHSKHHGAGGGQSLGIQGVMPVLAAGEDQPHTRPESPPLSQPQLGVSVVLGKEETWSCSQGGMAGMFVPMERSCCSKGGDQPSLRLRTLPLAGRLSHQLPGAGMCGASQVLGCPGDRRVSGCLGTASWRWHLSVLTPLLLTRPPPAQGQTLSAGSHCPWPGTDFRKVLVSLHLYLLRGNLPHHQRLKTTAIIFSFSPVVLKDR